MTARSVWGLSVMGLLCILCYAFAGCSGGFLGMFDGDDDEIDPLRSESFIAASAFEITADPSQSRILVAWDIPSRPQADPQQYTSYIIGYELYRSTSPNFSVTADKLVAVMLGGRQTQFIDSNTTSGLLATISLATSDLGIVTETVDSTADDGTTLPSRTVASDAADYVIAPSPLQSGETYYYAIKTIIKKLPPQPFPPQDTSGSGGGGSTTTSDYAGQIVVSGTPVYTGPATAIERPELVSPPAYPSPGSQDVELETVQFQWMTVPGADTYVIQVSMDRSFDEDQVLLSREIPQNNTNGGLQVARPFEGGGFSSSFEGYAGQIFWRIGAKRDIDRFEPIDVSDNRTVGWVYSEPSSFEAQSEPPLPPG